MPCSRRTVVCAALVSTVATLAGSFPAESHQTPEAADDWKLIGLVDGGWRQYQAPGLRLLGPVVIIAAAFRFDSDEHAAAALPEIVDHLWVSMGSNLSALQLASAPKLGDERLAFAGELPDIERARRGHAGSRHLCVERRPARSLPVWGKSCRRPID